MKSFVCALFLLVVAVVSAGSGLRGPTTSSLCPALNHNNDNPINGSGIGPGVTYSLFEPDMSTLYLPNKIWVRRHCDKSTPGDYSLSACSDPLWPTTEGTSKSCDAKGWQRGTEVGQVMGETIDVVMCARSNADGHHSYRPCEMAWQIVRSALPNTWGSLSFYSFHRSDFTNLTHALWHTPQNAGKNVLVVWDHGHIPGVMDALHYTQLPSGYWSGSLYSLTLTVTYPSANINTPSVTSWCDCVGVDNNQCTSYALAYQYPSVSGCLSKDLVSVQV